MPVTMLIDKSRYEFKVTVTDLNGHSNEADVSVRVESSQLFSELRWSQEEAYSSSIKENSPTGTQLIGVIVAPVDLLQGAKFHIGYKLVEPNDYFEIEEKTGVCF